MFVCSFFDVYLKGVRKTSSRTHLGTRPRNGYRFFTYFWGLDQRALFTKAAHGAHVVCHPGRCFTNTLTLVMCYVPISCDMTCGFAIPLTGAPVPLENRLSTCIPPAPRNYPKQEHEYMGVQEYVFRAPSSVFGSNLVFFCLLSFVLLLFLPDNGLLSFPAIYQH